MADVETPVQVGFAEFIARLMSEVFDSVITSQVDQEERYAEMLAAASLSEAAYGSQQIGDADVRAEIETLFPPREIDKEQTSAIYARSPYTAASKEQPESPALLTTLNIKVTKDDVSKSEAGLLLTQAAVDRVENSVRLRLAARHLAIIRQIVARGLPRVVVDSGRINGKLTFHLSESTQGQTGDGATLTGSTPTADLLTRTTRLTAATKSVFTLPKARILPNVKLMVKQADDQSPQSTQVTANVYGEVEITFKTVT